MKKFKIFAMLGMTFSMFAAQSSYAMHHCKSSTLGCVNRIFHCHAGETEGCASIASGGVLSTNDFSISSNDGGLLISSAVLSKSNLVLISADELPQLEALVSEAEKNGFSDSTDSK